MPRKNRYLESCPKGVIKLQNGGKKCRERVFKGRSKNPKHAVIEHRLVHVGKKGKQITLHKTKKGTMYYITGSGKKRYVTNKFNWLHRWHEAAPVQQQAPPRQYIPVEDNEDEFDDIVPVSTDNGPKKIIKTKSLRLNH